MRLEWKKNVVNDWNGKRKKNFDKAWKVRRESKGKLSSTSTYNYEKVFKVKRKIYIELKLHTQADFQLFSLNNPLSWKVYTWHVNLINILNTFFLTRTMMWHCRMKAMPLIWHVCARPSGVFERKGMGGLRLCKWIQITRFFHCRRQQGGKYSKIWSGARGREKKDIKVQWVEFFVVMHFRKF